MTQENLRALAAEYYASQDIYTEEREKLFFKTWQYACHISELARPGDYVSTSIMGQNVFVVKDTGGDIRAYYNICPHRGHKLLEGTGRTRSINCPYHHWSFALDGSLRHMRKRDTSHIPEQNDVCLKTVRVDQLLDFIFVNLDPDAEPIADYWPGVEAQVREKCPDVGTYVLGKTAAAIHEVDVAANWKIQIDNYLECQHCRHGHLSFTDMLDINNQTYELTKNAAYNFIPGNGKADNMAYPLDLEHDELDLHFWFLFPNIGISQFAGVPNITLFQWNPIGTDRGLRWSINLEPAEETDPGMRERQEKRAVWGRDVLQPEDISFLLSVQEGMSQRAFNQGWYIVDWENIEFSEAMMRHFHQTYLAHMGRGDMPEGMSTRLVAQAAE